MKKAGGKSCNIMGIHPTKVINKRLQELFLDVLQLSFMTLSETKFLLLDVCAKEPTKYPNECINSIQSTIIMVSRQFVVL